MSLRWDVDRARLDPEFADDVDAVFGADEASWVVHYGWRSREEQAALYRRHLAGGPLAAPPGRSPHEHGLAVDFHEEIDGRADYTVGPHWRRIMAAVDAHPRLHGGWHFPPVAPADDDHVQAVKWYQVRHDLIAAGTW